MTTEPTPTDSGAPDEQAGSATPAAFDFLSLVLQGVAPELKPVTLLAYDIDAFERDAALFSAQLGIPVDELLEIAAEARAGSDPTADKRPGQHVVSRSALAAWCTGTSRRAGDQLIWPYSLDNGPETPIDPTDVGKVTHFVQVDSVRTEQAWETVENTLRDDVRRLAVSPNLNDPRLVEKVKKIVALHWARSIETRDAIEAMSSRTVATKKAEYQQQPEKVDELYRMKPGNTAKVLSESERNDFVDEFLARSQWIFTSGTYFRFDVVYLFRAALEQMERLKVQILRAPTGSEFLVGDTPVIKLDEHGVPRGRKNPIAIRQAVSVLMPLSPRFMVVLDNLSRDFTISAADVRKYNSWQLGQASSHVFMHPTATSLMTWVENTRPPTATS